MDVARTFPAGNPLWYRDGAVGSSKTYVVPQGKRLYVRGIQAGYVATATVGNRAVYLQILDGSNNVLWSSGLSANITAGQARTVSYAPGGSALSGAAAYDVMAIPEMVIPEGYKIKLFDSAAIDAAADTLIQIIHGDMLDV